MSSSKPHLTWTACEKCGKPLITHPVVTGGALQCLPGAKVRPLHRHSFQPYALLDDDVVEAVCEKSPSGAPRSEPASTIYYVGYRCKECGEAGYRVPD